MNHSFEIYSNTELRSASGWLGGGSSSDDYHSVANHLARVCPAQHLWEMQKLGLTDLVAEVRQRKMTQSLLANLCFLLKKARSSNNGSADGLGENASNNTAQEKTRNQTLCQKLSDS